MRLSIFDAGEIVAKRFRHGTGYATAELVRALSGGEVRCWDLYQPAKTLTHFGFPLPAPCDSIPAPIRGRRAWAER